MKSLLVCLVLFSAVVASAKNPVFFEPLKNSTVSVDADTPLFEKNQVYLESSPKGVGARNAWSLPGGTGDQVKIVDIETAANTDHEDFKTPFYIGANFMKQSSSYNHGTSVWGEIASKNDGKGTTGISHGSQYGFFGFIQGDDDIMTPGYVAAINNAIQGAMANEKPGDIVVIEQEMHGPDGDTSVDYWPEIAAQLKKATDAGLICVEAAGNGGSNLDGDLYQGAFDLTKNDSGCIMVGAGDADLERLGFSNYGTRIDAFGFGESVTTTGYGDLFNGGDNRTYTSSFNGTSSATPIVAGAIAVVSSIAKAKGRILKASEIRAALRATGAPQGSATKSRRIGNLPDISALVKFLRI